MARMYDMMFGQLNADKTVKIGKKGIINGFNVLRAMRVMQVALITQQLIQPIVNGGGNIFL